MRKNQKYFTIRKDLTSPIQTLRYLGIFIDKWDYGLDLGVKNIRHCNTAIRMNSFIFNKNIKPRERNSYKINSRHIHDHMTGRKTYYFTSDPFSRYRLCVPDIDNKTDDKARIAPFLILFLSHFPDIFFDRGSSGKSLHPYLKLDMLALYDYYIFDSDDYRSYPKYANEILSQVGYILKIYGHHILAPEHTLVQDEKTGKFSPRYDLELDAIKGTYPDYDFFLNRKTGRYVITSVINHGVLVKLPRLVTPDDYEWFYSSRVYSILDILSFAVYIGSSLLLSSCVNDEERARVGQYLKSYETILMAHSVFPSSQEKSSVALNLSFIREAGPNNSNYCLGKSRFQPKNTDFDNSKEYDGNANTRRIAVIQRLCREHYKEHGILPTDEYLQEQYRVHPASTGEADTADIREIKEVSQFVKNEFKSELAGKNVKYERLRKCPNRS